jgi:hypothetical protein
MVYAIYEKSFESERLALTLKNSPTILGTITHVQEHCLCENDLVVYLYSAL